MALAVPRGGRAAAWLNSWLALAARKRKQKTWWAVEHLVRKWLVAHPMHPARVVLRCPHDRRFFSIYADPALRATLFGLQHDEKDIFRVLGPGGLQDWGDGVCQRLMTELKETDDATTAVERKLRMLPMHATPDVGVRVNPAQARM